MGISPSFPRVPLSKDHVVIVTGANTGLGYETAKWIAMMGATVIMACRSEERALLAIRHMNEEFRQHKEKGTEGLAEYGELCLEFIKLDCASLKSVMEFVETFKESRRRLKVLILNAGVGFHRQAYTEDDHELHFQVNYLSQFLLAAQLLPVMLVSGDDCRIIIVSSIMYKACRFNIETIEGKQCNDSDFGRVDYYSRSKLYQIMQMFSMNRRLKDTNVSVTVAHPGYVDTEITRNCNDMRLLMIGTSVGKLFGSVRQPFEGAITQINSAVNPELRGVRNVFFGNCKPESLTSAPRNETHQELLWDYSLECLKDYLSVDVMKALEGND